jgi:hypothetical protein
MGGSQAKTAINNLNTQITNIATSVIQQCVVNTGQTQTVSSNNSGFQLGSTLSVTQTTSVSSSCFSNASIQTNLQNQITSAIQQTANANGVALLGAVGASQTNASTYIQNTITNNVTMKNIQQNYNTIMQTQSVTINNSGQQLFSTVDITQGATVFANATLQAVSNTGILNALSNSIAQQSTATTSNPLDFIANIVGSVATAISSSLAYVVIFVIAVIAGIGYLLLGGASSVGSAVSSDGDDQQPQDENPEESEEEPQNIEPANNNNEEENNENEEENNNENEEKNNEEENNSEEENRR